MKTAIIFDIQRFSIHDGPGIRTTVFFKGCNLRCFWCHNPESLLTDPEIQFLPIKCIGCGRCLTNCPYGCQIAVDSGHIAGGGQIADDSGHIANGSKHATDGGGQIADDSGHVFDRKNCHMCGACVEGCYAGALSFVGRAYTVDEALEVVMRDAPFYKNTGGMTCSGGEPLLYHEFAAELLEKARRAGIHTAVDTAGNVPFDRLEAVMPYTGLFLYDIKTVDEAAHIKSTGAGTGLIHENLRKLSKAGAEIWVRVPVVPTVNNTTEDMEKIAMLVKPLEGVKLVELLSFHKLGGGKYESLGKAGYPAMHLDPPGKDEMQTLAAVLEAQGVKTKVS